MSASAERIQAAVDHVRRLIGTRREAAARAHLERTVRIEKQASTVVHAEDELSW